jgi:hypothetical protein
LFVGLGTGATLGLTAGRNGSSRPNRFVLRNDNHAGDRLLDHVDDRGQRVRTAKDRPLLGIAGTPV